MRVSGYVRGICIQHANLQRLHQVVGAIREYATLSKDPVATASKEGIRAEHYTLHRLASASGIADADNPVAGNLIIVEQDYRAFSQLEHIREQPLYWVFTQPKSRHRSLIRHIIGGLNPGKPTFVQVDVMQLYELMMNQKDAAKRMSMTKLIARLSLDTQIATIWLNGRPAEDIRLSRVFREAFSEFKFTAGTLGVRFTDEEDSASMVHIYLDRYGNFTLLANVGTPFIDALSEFISYLRQFDLLSMSLENPVDRGPVIRT